MPTEDPESCEALEAVITNSYRPPSPGTGFYRSRGEHPADMEFRVTSVVDRANPEVTWSRDAGQPRRGEPGWLPGDADLVTRIKFGRSSERLPIEILSAFGRLALDDGRTRDIRIRATTNAYGEPRLVVSIPDIEGTGVLAITAEWQHRCLAFVGTASRAVTVVPGDVVRACPESTNDAVRSVRALLEPAPELTGVPLDVHTTSVVWVWKGGGFSGQGDALGTWDRGAAGVFGPAGSTLALRSANPDLAFRSIGATYYHRADVVDWLDGNRARPRAIKHLEGMPIPDGSHVLPIPTDRGRYVAVLGLSWESPCLRGGSYALMSVDAR